MERVEIHDTCSRCGGVTTPTISGLHWKLDDCVKYQAEKIGKLESNLERVLTLLEKLADKIEVK